MKLLSLTLVALTLAGLERPPSAAAAEMPMSRGVERAQRLLSGGAERSGEVHLIAALRLSEESFTDSATLAAVLEVLVPIDGAGVVAGVPVVISAVFSAVDGSDAVFQHRVVPGDLGASRRWLLEASVEVPEDFQDGAVAVEVGDGSTWGASLLELSDESLAGALPGTYVERAELTPPRDVEPAVAAGSRVIRLLRPRSRPVTGNTRLQTLTSIGGIDRTVFYLDGKEVAIDERHPFSATVDLGSSGRQRVARVEAYSRQLLLGADEMIINEPQRPLRVEITRLAKDAESGAVDVEAEVTVPAGRGVSRVDFSWNNELVESLEEPPFRVSIPSRQPTDSDFVVVTAYLDDGGTVEDVRLLSASGPVERVEVNLVEVYAVVTDRDGQPVRDLSERDFRLQQGGRERPIERFELAEDVPLSLGLVVDTSESMYALMPDTKAAGMQFLAEVLGRRDRAFLVDFDTKPRLALGTTGDLGKIARGFGGLQADGATAMYDAVIFSLLQFDEAPGRRALVMLTDGDDYRSRFGPSRCISEARRAGVPVYVLALGGLHHARAGLRRIDIEGIAEASGGRVFYIGELGELDAAYSVITAELRSQYLLAYSTPRQLSDRELRSIDVKLRKKGYDVRAVVGAQ